MRTTTSARLNPWFLISYLVMFTGLRLLPGVLTNLSPIQLAILLLFSYGLLSWLMLAILGKCPLRWRKLSPWVLLFAFAHAYWIEFLLSLWGAAGTRPSFLFLLPASVGAMAGISLRLHFSYKQCNCSLRQEQTNRELIRHAQAELVTQLPESDKHRPHTIADHPGLNSIIAHSFGWKALTVRPGTGIAIHMVCTGKSLVSLPHFSYGQIAHTHAGPVDWQQVLSAYALPRNIADIEIRQTEVVGQHTEKVSSWLALSESIAGQMLAFRPNLRRKVSKGYRNGFEVKSGKLELLNAFWKVYSHHMFELGSVALPKKFFFNLLTGYTDGEAVIFLLLKENKVVGGAFCLCYKGFFENCWFATLHKVQPLYASYVLHHAMIAYAVDCKCHTYSFGRSSNGGGVHAFKKQWGAVDIPLLWIHYPAKKTYLRKQRWLLYIWKIMPASLRHYPGGQLAKWVY